MCYYIIMKTIVLDIDGVVLRWNSRLLEFLKRKNIRIFKRIASIVKENKFLNVKELDSHFKNGFLNSYHSSPEAALFDVHYERLPEILNELKKEYRIIALTAFSVNKESEQRRRDNLELHFKDIFEEVYFVPPMNSKKDKLKELSKEYDIQLFVDDSSLHIKEAKVLFGENKVFHFKKPKDWEKIYKKLIN